MQFSLRDQSMAGGHQLPRDNQTMARLLVPDPELAPIEAGVRTYARLNGLGGGVDIRV
jgi:hypothetical protein